MKPLPAPKPLNLLKGEEVKADIAETFHVYACAHTHA